MLRAAYREHLDAFNADVVLMSDTVRSVMSHATAALLEQSLDDAETALTQADDIGEIRRRCEDRSTRLLALENPVASELRRIITSIYIVENFNRMGALARNIALLARQRHPAPVFPAALNGYVAELARLVYELGETVHSLLVNPDADVAVALHDFDEGVDDLKAYLFSLVTDRDWEYSTREAVDLAVLVRYFERYADRCVDIGARLVYLITGKTSEAYIRQREEVYYDPDQRFAAIEEKFRRK